MRRRTILPALIAISRRRLLPLALATLAVAAISAAQAATPSETFISNNIQRSFEILNGKELRPEQRSRQFQDLLLGIVDMKRIALFTLGQYGGTASLADQDRFVAAFQNYAIASYQTYFARYAGQTLTVSGSTERAPQDVIVMTMLRDPNDHSGQQPLEVDFRVRSDTGKPMLVDFSVAGMWLALEERDQFVAFLDHNDGSIPKLTDHLNQAR
jgi:phospholipid transport system substrate-binding protein